ncbi:MAG: ribonuclease HI [Chloroherpetonaceae bacterium]|nr:ribonuclease HI [Chloroherpetonaceae bacterium]
MALSQTKEKEVIIYTDGACSGNPGEGGWGAILIYNGTQREISGYVKETTNNRMEMMAAIMALSELKERCSVHLHTDSNYIVQAFNEGWLQGWKSRGWKTAKKSPVLNQDLWKQLESLTEKHTVTFVKVKGHSDDELNNRADFLATSAISNHRN